MQHNSAQSDGVFEFRRHNFTNNPVRFVDAFVDALSLVALGFKIQTLKAGRPSFDTKVFLKIYLYGYLNGVRSSS
jgi:transposase